MTADYTPHFAAIAEADRKRVAAEAELVMARNAMGKAALDEARASIAATGVEIAVTILTARARWDYQDRPVIVRSVTCWDPPEEPGYWLFQVHYVRATNAGQPVKGASKDWRNIACAHPSEFGEELLARMPLWGDRRMRGHTASPRPNVLREAADDR